MAGSKWSVKIIKKVCQKTFFFILTPILTPLNEAKNRHFNPLSGQNEVKRVKMTCKNVLIKYLGVKMKLDF